MQSWKGDRGGGRGRGDSRSQGQRATRATPRWQKPKEDAQKRYSLGSGWGYQWAPYALLAAALLVAFLYIILRNPGKTPVIALIGTEYAAPTPPNAWALEDLQALKDLKNSLLVEEVTGSWIDADTTAMNVLSELLGKHTSMYRGLRPISEPLVVYISMPGVVNKDREPCLLPPGASPFDEEQWIKLETVLGMFKTAEVPEARNKLVVLDCQQTNADWRMGIVYNTFTERVKSLANDVSVPNLAILTAADEGQRSWASPALRGTVFGRFFWLGVAGEADQQSQEPDGKVSLAELQAYLERHVGGWAVMNRNALQNPVLLKGAEAEQFIVSHARSGRVLGGHRDSLKSAGAPSPSIDVENELIPLWQGLERLRGRRAAHYAPGVLAEHESNLVRLERLAYGGKAYAKSAKALSKRLAGHLREITGDPGSPSLLDHWEVIDSEESSFVKTSDPLFSLPLRAYLGKATLAEVNEVKELWARVSSGPGDLEGTKSKINARVFGKAAGLSTTQMLVAARQLGVESWGVTPNDLQNAHRIGSMWNELAVPADAKQRPSDERAHYYVRAGLDLISPRLRDVQDSLYYRVEGRDGRGFRFESIKDDLKKMAVVRDRINRAHAIKDDAWSRLPHLAAWVCRLNDRGGLEEPPQKVARVAELIDLNHDVGDTLAKLAQQGETVAGLVSESQRLEEYAEVVQKQLRDFQEAFTAEYSDLGVASNGADLHAIDVALGSPLTGSALRAKLLQDRDRIAAKLHADFFKGSTPPASELMAGEGSADQAAMAASQAIAAWRESPLLKVLAPSQQKVRSEEADGDLGRLDAQNRVARERLADPPALVSRPNPLTGEARLASLVDRDPVALAERRYRAVAPLTARRLASSPVVRLRRFDLQQLMLWHTGDQIDSFWHMVSPKNADSLKEFYRPATLTERLFEQAGNSYLGIARRFVGENEGNNYKWPAVREQIQGLEELLSQRVTASRHNPMLGASSRLAFGEPGVFNVSLEFSPPGRGGSLPQGHAALHMLPKSRSRPEEIRRRVWGNVETPLASSHQGKVRDVRSSLQDVVLFFRGMTHTKEVDIQLPNEPVLAFEWPDYEQQSIQLSGDKTNPPLVVFILDCSGSMATRLPSEGNNNLTRMEAAIGALEAMLAELSNRDEDELRVGVYFFGHRYKWENPVSQGPIRNNLQPKKENRQLFPGEDIEAVLPLGLYGTLERGDIRERLDTDKLQPWGLTPVYASIIQALGEFEKFTKSTSKSVIVITDGKNVHEQPAGFRTIFQPSLPMVLDAWDRENRALEKPNQVAVHIIGFDVTKSEQAEASEEFKKIADHAGGLWFETSSSAELIKFLNDRLDVDGYTVLDTRGRLLSPGEDPNKDKTPLNQQVQISKNAAPLPAEVRVQFQDLAKSVVLEGGEALELRVNDSGSDIVAIPYDRGVVADAELAAQGAASADRVLFRVHKPLRNTRSGAVRFRFSLQSEDSHFTPRPKFIWAEVKPDGAADASRFYDPVFQPLTPVPVIAFNVSNWPAQARQARVHFWCSEQAPTSTQTVELARVPVDSRRLEEFGSGVPGIDLAIEWKDLDEEYVLIVREKHTGGNVRLDTLRVWLEFKDASTRPRSVSRSSIAGSGVKHVYRFTQSLPPSQFAKQVSIHCASGDQLKANALSIPDEDGLLVPIYDDSATHSTTVTE